MAWTAIWPFSRRKVRALVPSIRRAPASTARRARSWSKRSRSMAMAWTVSERSQRVAPPGAQTRAWLYSRRPISFRSTPAISSARGETRPEQWVGTPTWGCSSRRATRKEARARFSAKVLPAGPAPTTMASNWLLGSGLAVSNISSPRYGRSAIPEAGMLRRSGKGYARRACQKECGLGGLGGRPGPVR